VGCRNKRCTATGKAGEKAVSIVHTLLYIVMVDGAVPMSPEGVASSSRWRPSGVDETEYAAMRT
jgi:hypothetical protein